MSTDSPRNHKLNPRKVTDCTSGEVMNTPSLLKNRSYHGTAPSADVNGTCHTRFDNTVRPIKIQIAYQQFIQVKKPFTVFDLIDGVWTGAVTKNRTAENPAQIGRNIFSVGSSQ